MGNSLDIYEAEFLYNFEKELDELFVEKSETLQSCGKPKNTTKQFIRPEPLFIHVFHPKIRTYSKLSD